MRAITLRRIGWPRWAWYWRASFQAASTASLPPDTKKKRLMFAGVISASFSASAIAGGCAYVQFV